MTMKFRWDTGDDLDEFWTALAIPVGLVRSWNDGDRAGGVRTLTAVPPLAQPLVQA